MFQSFAANHYLLSRGTPEQKVQLAAALIEGYKIPLADFSTILLNMAEIAGQESPEIVALRKEIQT
jgi:hypothetical protein